MTGATERYLLRFGCFDGRLLLNIFDGPAHAHLERAIELRKAAKALKRLGLRARKIGNRILYLAARCLGAGSGTSQQSGIGVVRKMKK